MDIDHGKMLIIELVRDIAESNLWYQFGGNPLKFSRVFTKPLFEHFGGHLGYGSWENANY